MLATYTNDEDNSVEVVTLGSDPENYLQVQRALMFDEQDVRLGMDTYCLVTGSGITMYGGVEECTVDDRRVHLIFSPQAAERLGVPTKVSIVVEGDAYQQVTTALTRMLA